MMGQAARIFCASALPRPMRSWQKPVKGSKTSPRRKLRVSRRFHRCTQMIEPAKTSQDLQHRGEEDAEERRLESKNKSKSKTKTQTKTQAQTQTQDEETHRGIEGK